MVEGKFNKEKEAAQAMWETELKIKIEKAEWEKLQRIPYELTPSLRVHPLRVDRN